MDYGLGLVLSFTDKASKGIYNATRSIYSLTQSATEAAESIDSLTSLTAFSTVATQFGDSLINKGASIVSFFNRVVKTVNNTGQSLINAESQLDSLYADSGRTGKEVLNDINSYARKSIFSFEELMSIVTQLKSVGLDAFNTVTSSSGESSQSLLEYGSDLASFFPRIHNAYGTGVSAAMGALNEYITEGNSRTLKSSASLDIKSILGEDVGKTVEDRSRQIADLMEKMNMVGITASMSNTPMTKLSNITDVWYQLLGKIANSGVYDAFNDIISVFSDFVTSISDEELEEIARAIGEAFIEMLEPVKELAKYIVSLAKSFKDLIKENPNLVKSTIAITALTGALTLIIGVVSKASGTLGFLFVGLKGLPEALSAVPGILKTFAPALKAILPLLSSILPIVLAIAGAIGVVYVAWKYDFAGIRTTVTEFTDHVKTSFSDATEAVSGSYEDMINAINNKKIDPNSFWGGLTTSIMKILVIIDALKQGWDDYTISEDTYQKADKLGVRTIIEGFFDLKYRFDKFIEGFTTTYNAKVKPILEDIYTMYNGKLKSILDDIFAKFGMKVDGTVFEAFFDSLTKVSKDIKETDPEKFKAMGELLALIPLVNGMKFNEGFMKFVEFLVKGANAIEDLGDKEDLTITSLDKTFSTWNDKFITWWTTDIKPYIDTVLEFFRGIKDVGKAMGSLFIFGEETEEERKAQERLDKIEELIEMGYSRPIAIKMVDDSDYEKTLEDHAKKNEALYVKLKKGLHSFTEEVLNVRNKVLEWVSLTGGIISAHLSNFVDFVKINLVAAFETASTSIKSAFYGIFKYLFGGLNNLITLVNGVITAKNKLGGEQIELIKAVEIPEFAEGGIVTRPTNALIGEDGAEAVMPLKNNTEWIGHLANDLSNRMISRGSSNEASRGNVDNSVVFNEGAIQINCSNASEAEAQRLAKRIIDIIKRQKEIDDMTSYAF